jgi:hypothetical protein
MGSPIDRARNYWDKTNLRSHLPHAYLAPANVIGPLVHARSYEHTVAKRDAITNAIVYSPCRRSGLSRLER